MILPVFNSKPLQTYCPAIDLFCQRSSKSSKIWEVSLLVIPVLTQQVQSFICDMFFPIEDLNLAKVVWYLLQQIQAKFFLLQQKAPDVWQFYQRRLLYYLNSSVREIHIMWVLGEHHLGGFYLIHMREEGISTNLVLYFEQIQRERN